jgi:hypothetical protein
MGEDVQSTDQGRGGVVVIVMMMMMMMTTTTMISHSSKHVGLYK